MICVELPHGKGVKAWDDFFGRFAMQAITHAVAVAVDGQGTVVRCPLRPAPGRARQGEWLVGKGG
jgi:hypothetical protein